MSSIPIIQIVYGPKARTRRSLRRLHRLTDGHISAVAAHPAALHSIGPARSNATEAIGTNGIIEALADREGPVLMIHDDIHLTKMGLERMLETHSRLGGYVVPYTNDLEMDHFGGSTPPADHTEPSLLDDRSADFVVAQVHAVRPVCVLANASDLAILCERPLVDPNIRLDDVDMGFNAAPTLAAHDGVCPDRVGPARDHSGKPLLVAAMIVRDEEEMLPPLLEALEPLVDRIEACDTGSTDGTIAVLEAAGANIIHREWRDDFGWARNEVLEQCRDAAYVLLVDADDRIQCEDPDALRRYLATYSHEHNAFAVEVADPDHVANASAIRSVRIVRADAVAFTGAVHELAVWREQPDLPIRGQSLDLLRITHIGYDPAVVVTKDKVTRNLEISRNQYEEVGDFKAIIEYGRSLIGAGGDPEEIIALFSKARRMAMEAPPATRAYVSAVLAQHLNQRGDHERALVLAEEALKLIPDDDMAAGAAAVACRSLGRPAALVDLSDRYDAAPSMAPLFKAEGDRTAYSQALIVARAQTGDGYGARNALRVALSDGPFPHWGDLLQALDAGGVVGWLAGIADETDDIGYLEWAIDHLSPGSVARLCLDYLEVHGEPLEVAVAGAAHAIVAGGDEVLQDLAPYLYNLNPDQLHHLITTAADKGLVSGAQALQAVGVGS